MRAAVKDKLAKHRLDANLTGGRSASTNINLIATDERVVSICGMGSLNGTREHESFTLENEPNEELFEDVEVLNGYEGNVPISADAANIGRLCSIPATSAGGDIETSSHPLRRRTRRRKL